MIRLALCDDSPAFLQQTKFMIDHWDAPAAHGLTVELFEDGDALLTAHNKNPFDIILLDIVMPFLNGLDAARELRERDKTAKIVFLTTSPEFAVESYTVKASNYLLKPVSPESLFDCLDELIRDIQSVARCIVVKGVDATHKVALSDIIYVEAQLKHVLFHLKDARTIESAEPFYTYKDTLMLEDGFFHCHRSYIVNIHHIDNYSHSGISMRPGQHIPISRACQKSFENAYFQVVFGKVGDEL